MKQKHSLQILISYLLPHKMRLTLAVVSSIVNKLCDIVPEMLIGLSIDIIIRQQQSFVASITGITNPLTQLYVVGALTAILWIMESLFEYFYLILWRSLAQDVQHSLRISAYAHMQTLDLAYFENKTTGGLLTIINDDINALEQFLSEGPNAVIQLAINIFVMGGLFFVISPTLAILTLLPVPFVIAIAYFFQRRLGVLYELVRERLASLGGHIAGRLTGITTIKSYTTEEYEQEALTNESIAYKEANHKASHISAMYIPIVRMGILCGFIMSLIVGGSLALQGKLVISMYSVLVFLTQRFLWPFTTFTTITDLYEKAMASARRVFTLLAEKNTITNGDHQLTIALSEGAFSLKNVSFSYPNGTTIFHNLSLDIPAKKTVAFVGTTGSGKSTIIKLLLRLYDYPQGTITLDGHNIKTCDTQSLRKAIALVSQDVYLINGTIAENIAYGMPHIPRAAIIDAAKMAEAHTFIATLPQGYDTIIGENGKNLSGGQRQRLSIARAILKNPPIFIFDEATAALDNDTEAAIQRSMASIAHAHTMIIIAHRLSTVRYADTIFVMEKGQIVESGTHDALLQKNGAYASLWNIQTGNI